jgi:hypothetical protein
MWKVLIKTLLTCIAKMPDIFLQRNEEIRYKVSTIFILFAISSTQLPDKHLPLTGCRQWCAVN